MIEFHCCEKRVGKTAVFPCRRILRTGRFLGRSLYATDATMEAADVLYGVTLNEDGTSKVLSMKFA